MHVGHVPRISPKRGSPAGHLTPGPRVTRGPGVSSGKDVSRTFRWEEGGTVGPVSLADGSL